MNGSVAPARRGLLADSRSGGGLRATGSGLLHTNRDAEPKMARKKRFLLPKARHYRRLIQPEALAADLKLSKGHISRHRPDTRVFTSRLKTGVMAAYHRAERMMKSRQRERRRCRAGRVRRAAAKRQKNEEPLGGLVLDLESASGSPPSLSFTEAFTAVVKGVRAAGRGQ